MGAVVTGNKIEFTATRTLPYTSNGVTWTSPSANHFHAQGTATANSLLYFHNQYAMPSWLEFDKQYNVYFPKTGNTNNVVFGIELQRNSDLSWYTAYFNYRETGSFTVPTEAQGYRQIIVYVRLSNGYTANETVHPYLVKTVPYTPRFNDNGMRGSIYYSGTTGGYYAMPNCTRYCYGRWWEIMGQQPSGLYRLGNAEDWWGDVTAYQKGQTPRLGAIICFADGPYSKLGHVAVVEKIYSNGDVLFSNSGYEYKYFYKRCANGRDNYHSGKRGWYGYETAYRFQGFIYLPDEYSPTPTPEPTPSDMPKPLWFYLGRWPF